MTPVNQPLDIDLVLGPNPLHVYRLTRRKYAILSGIGASLAPGRWNRLGEEAIYTSLEKSGAVLECLAHTPKEKIPADLVMMKLTIQGKWTRAANSVWDVATSGAFMAINTLREAEGIRIYPRPTFAVAVPSVILPIWNIVLFPARKGFWDHVSVDSIEPFSYDPRLFPENASAE